MPIHPGEILRSEFLEPLGMSATKLALLMGVPATRINAIVSSELRRSITADTACRLAKVFDGVSAEFWMNLQSRYDLELIEYSGQLDQIRREVRELPAEYKGR